MSNFLILLVVVIAVWVAAFGVVGLVIVARPSPTPIMRYPLIVLYAALLHYVWAGALIIDPRAGEATSMSGLFDLFGRETLIVILIGVATLALVYVFLFSERRVEAALFALPQQAILLMSAWTAITAMGSGHFADGVVRPIPFILADQAPAVIAAVLHAAAILIGLWRPRRERVVATT